MDNYSFSVVESSTKIEFEPPKVSLLVDIPLVRYTIYSPNGLVFTINSPKFSEFCQRNNISQYSLMRTIQSGKPISVGKGKGWKIYQTETIQRKHQSAYRGVMERKSSFE
jgi:hypothetical protein